MKIAFPKGTREAIDKATAPLDQRLEVLERRLTQLEDDHAYKVWNAGSLYGAGARVIHKNGK
jgi:hypothetical protein